MTDAQRESDDVQSTKIPMPDQKTPRVAAPPFRPLAWSRQPKKTPARQQSAARALAVGWSETACATLIDAGYVTGNLTDASQLITVLNGFLPDVVILDTKTWGRDGFTMIATIRQVSDVGILLITEQGWATRLSGLAEGADGHLVEPVHVERLISCIEVVLARRGRQSSSAVQFGDLVIDMAQGVVGRSGVRLDLTPLELRMLNFLAEQRGCVVSGRQIMNALWGQDLGDLQHVQNCISSLRRKLEAHGPRILHTAYKLGYRLQPNTH